ncbi:hypothetical protein FF38_13651 [Lucilia cuprina]|uniref:PASTA domain-containing protein n=1 Tax=Lucilia cuprina TaxID=7375 RepID=A0A0L0CP60_LUCCU|nr:hypothetical protein FF38_13651 [Lucilia cuprina]
MRRTQAGPPAAWIWAGVAVLAVVLISVLIWVMTSRPGTPVPQNSRIVEDVTDMSWDRASETLTAQDLQPRRVDQSSDQITEGNVIRTDPGAGTTVAPGQSITVYVSTGQQTSAVPALTGLSSTQAEAALKTAGLQLGAVTTRSDPDLAQGIVMQGRRAARGVRRGRVRTQPGVVQAHHARAHDPRSAVGDRVLPEQPGAADPGHRRLEPGDRLRHRLHRVPHDDALALTPARPVVRAVHRRIPL